MTVLRQGLNLLCVLILITFTVPGVVQANLGRDYGESIKYLRNKDWAEAEQKIREAIKKNGQAQEKILLSGSNHVPYVPYYVLGAALFGQGDCAGAIEAWEEALRQGHVQKLAAEYRDLQSGLTQCKASLPDTVDQQVEQVAEQAENQPVIEPEPPPVEEVDVAAIARAVEQAIGDFDLANKKYAQLADDPDLAKEWSADWKPALDVAQGKSGEFRRRLEQALVAKDSAAINALGVELQSAQGDIRQQQAEADFRLASLRRQNAELLAEEKAAERTLQQQEEAQRRLATIQEREAAQQRQDELRQHEKLLEAQRELGNQLANVPKTLNDASGNEQVQTSRKQLASQVASSRAKLSSTSIADIENGTRALRTGIRKYNQAVQEWQAAQLEIAQRTPPLELKKMADAYFSGNYDAVSRMADPGKFTEKRQQIQAYLFRSASLFNQYWLTGANNQALLDKAGNDVVEIRKLNREFSPYIAAFSPKYIEFYKKL